MASNLDWCLAYLEKLPPAISGSGGHSATLRAACECVRFGLSDGEMWVAMQAYNARCQPPWTEQELRHKMESAKNKASFGERVGRGRTVKPVSAAELLKLSAGRVHRKPHPAVVPIARQSEAAEEAWWAKVATERGMTLAEFDTRAGVEQSPI